jgi:hypothetical protein
MTQAKRDEIARAMFEAFQRKCAEIDGTYELANWNEDSEAAEQGRSCFIAAADAVLALSALERAEPSPAWLHIQELVRQYRDAWREALEQIDGEASQRENWDQSDRNIAGFDHVMDSVLLVTPAIVAEERGNGALERAQPPREQVVAIERENAKLIVDYYRCKIGRLMQHAQHWHEEGQHPLAVHHRVMGADTYYQVVALFGRMDAHGQNPFDQMRTELGWKFTRENLGAYPPSLELHAYRDVRHVANLLDSPTPGARRFPAANPEAAVEAGARAVAVRHYAQRFGKPADDPHVKANADANWNIFTEDVRAALTAVMAHGLITLNVEQGVSDG